MSTSAKDSNATFQNKLEQLNGLTTSINNRINLCTWIWHSHLIVDNIEKSKHSVKDKTRSNKIRNYELHAGFRLAHDFISLWVSFLVLLFLCACMFSVLFLLQMISWPSVVSFSFPLLKFCKSNTLLWTAGLVLQGKFSILSRMRVNSAPWSGLVKKSASMSCMGQNAAFTSPFLILSVTKK